MQAAGPNLHSRRYRAVRRAGRYDVVWCGEESEEARETARNGVSVKTQEMRAKQR